MTKKSSKILPVIWIPVLLLILMVQFLGCQSAPPPPPAAPAPDAAKAQVDIKASPAATAKTDASPSPSATVAEEDSGPIIPTTFKPKSKKDPFVPVVPGAQDAAAQQQTPTPVVEDTKTPEDGKKGTVKQVHQPKPQVKKGPTLIEVKEGDVGVTISGIMQVGGGYKAILNGAGGSSYIVATGEPVGDYTVSSITARSVVLVYKKGGVTYKATLKLKANTGSPGKGGGTAPKTDSGPKAPVGEAPPSAP
ncbi:MAG: hypothetical protein LWY06_15620 [Firmicutes bacterium]|nr:hypothetical protein [Bacillota bacterium]